MVTAKIKVYELAKDLGQDSQYLVDVIQRLGIDIKNSMSALGSEEVRTVREYLKKQRPAVKAQVTPVVPQVSKTPISERRVGATVIRRRAKAPEKVEPVPVVPEEPTEPEPAETTSVFAAMDSMPTPAPVVDLPATPPSEATAEAPAIVAPEQEKPILEPKKAPPLKRSFPSIIKKVAVETYLGEKVGPKVEKKEKPKETAEIKKKETADQVAKPLVGLKRVREIDLSVPEPTKEVARKRLLERQSSVFKSADYLKRELIHATKKKKAVSARPALKTLITRPAEHKRVVEMGDSLVVVDLANALGIKATEVIKKLMALGVTATINQTIDFDTASLVAHEFQYEIRQKVFREENYLPPLDLAPEKLKPRSPVVTVMGHVDHGKTSLLDAIRKTQVAAGEHGGITQHIGAYLVRVDRGTISFLDTPGHEAFTAMRARGAKVTDIVVLVVSAVDGVMPQTLESLDHAKAAMVPVIVAINKTDLPNAEPERIKQTLAGHGLNPEEWGGDTIFVNVSAKTQKGVDKLLESILLQAEMLELKANFETSGRAAIIESRLDKGRGPVATALIQHGVLRQGDLVVCGTVFGKIRAMMDSFGKRISEASPGEPVEILGLPEVPTVGEGLCCVESEDKAKTLTEARLKIYKEKFFEAQKPKISLEDMLKAPGGEKELRMILKADVQGSTEALREAIAKFPSEKIKFKMLHAATGGITESDVMLATASQAVILGFNVRPDLQAQRLSEVEKVIIRTYTIIYDLLDDLKKIASGLLDKVVTEKVIGRAEVRNVFHIPKIGAIAGSSVLDGKVVRGGYLRLLRDNRVVYTGRVGSLKRFKEDVKEVASGFECGIGVENFNDVKQGDHFEIFVKEETQGIL